MASFDGWREAEAREASVAPVNRDTKVLARTNRTDPRASGGAAPGFPHGIMGSEKRG